jgi:hypothetical protein
MRTMMRASTLAVFLAALALATGCEDTPLLAGKDFKMTLVAEVAAEDPDDPDRGPAWNIIASVVNEANAAQSGITVFFSATTGGVLAHGSAGVSTHSDGRAIDLLTLAPGAPASITVTATSAALTKTVNVTATGDTCDINTAPSAVINPSSIPTLPGKTGTENTVPTPNLSGATSHDHQTAVENLSYSWDCDGGTSTSTVEDHVICVYTYQTTEQHHTITLTVTDDGLQDETGCEKSDQATISVTVPGTAPPS